MVLEHIRNAKHLVHANPKVIKIRRDVTWEEVLQNWRHNVYNMDYAGMLVSEAWSEVGEREEGRREVKGRVGMERGIEA